MDQQQEWVEIKIAKWNEYNGRKDVTHPSWFRVEYRMLEDPELSYLLTHGEFHAWFYFLALACRKNSARIRVSYKHAEAAARLTRADINGAIEKLCQIEALDGSVTPTSRGRNADVTPTLRDRQTDRQTNTSETSSDSSTEVTENPGNEILTGEKVRSTELEAIYLRYPRHEGKSRGLKTLRAQIKTRDDLDALSLAIENYRRSETVRKGFVKLFSTFASEWRDWIDPGHGRTVIGDSGELKPVDLEELFK